MRRIDQEGKRNLEKLAARQIYCCQCDIAWEDKQANFAKVRSFLAQAKPVAGSLVVLPEMFATGFSMNVGGIAEKEPSETGAFLAEQARQWKVFLVGGLVTTGSAGRGRNQAVAYSPDGRELVRYTKIHPFSLGGESVHYESGQALRTFIAGQWVVAPFICYDLRFPEVFRVAVRRGAQVVLVLANWPEKRIGHWVSLLQARAIENQVYVAGVNRCGNDPFLVYNGQSMIVSPNGEVLAQAGSEEKVICASLDGEMFVSLRSGLPFLQDMRLDYGSLG